MHADSKRPARPRTRRERRGQRKSSTNPDARLQTLAMALTVHWLCDLVLTVVHAPPLTGTRSNKAKELEQPLAFACPGEGSSSCSGQSGRVLAGAARHRRTHNLNVSLPCARACTTSPSTRFRKAPHGRDGDMAVHGSGTPSAGSPFNSACTSPTASCSDYMRSMPRRPTTPAGHLAVVPGAGPQLPNALPHLPHSPRTVGLGLGERAPVHELHAVLRGSYRS